MTSALLSVEGLTVQVGHASHPVVLVDSFGLDMDPGDRVALVGETGSGKTLVARSIVGLTSGLSVTGTVRFKELDLLGLSEREMRSIRGRRIGMVFQNPMGSLNPIMTIGAQVAEPLRMAGVSKSAALARAGDVLGELGIAGARGRLSAYPHEFSGGMRQRVALAIALVGEPDLLIADEPTTALDVRVQEQVLDLLDRVAAERRLAVLMITHDLAAVAGFADRVAVMYSGLKVHEEAVDQIFADPAHPYTARLLDAVPRLGATGKALHPIPGTPPHPAERPSGCPFHPRCATATDVCSALWPATTVTPSGGTVHCHWPRIPDDGSPV